jgi:hypothetical protein
METENEKGQKSRNATTRTVRKGEEREREREREIVVGTLSSDSYINM